MERSHLRGLAVAALLTAATVSLGAQEPSYLSVSTTHYRVLSDVSESFCREVGRKMEAALLLYNQYFHFDLSTLPAPLRVRVFRDKSDYDRYLQQLISETRSDFVFIAYKDAARSELVGFQREQFDPSLLHYGFIQFLNAYVPGAPLWLEEGLATYLEQSVYDPATRSFTFRRNYAWLEPLKGILRNQQRSGRLGIADILVLSKQVAEANIELFYPAAWGLVDFLLESPDRQVNRILWDSISTLAPDRNMLENSRQVRQKAFSWIGAAELQQAFSAYILSLKTFNELVMDGVTKYDGGELEEARSLFLQAAQRRPDSYLPQYYLGLIAYQQKKYDEATGYYRSAERLGVDPALAQWALGVNAFADRDFELAIDYLTRARDLDPSSFGDKVEALLKRIEVMR